MSDKFVRLAAAQGDIFHATTAGGAKSIESLEDNIDAKMLAYVGSDLTQGSFGGSTSPTTIATVTIPANTVNTGILVTANIWLLGTGTACSLSFALKIGATGAEVAKQTIVLNEAANTLRKGAMLQFYDATQTWTSEVTVLVVVTPNDANGTGYCESALVWGA